MNVVNTVSTIMKNPYNPIGLPQQEGLFDASKWSLIEKIDTFNRQSKPVFDALGTIWHYISHPILIWNGFLNLSYWGLLIACMCFMLVYLICNDKKQLQNGGKAFAIYFLIRLLNLCFK